MEGGMGKHRKLRSSVKVLHEAVTRFTPSAAAPFCIQPARTHSFRDLVTSFNSVYYTTPPSSSASSSSHLCSHHCLCRHLQYQSSADTRPATQGEVEEEAATTSTGAASSTSFSTSSIALAAAAADVPADDTEAFTLGMTNPERFFFSPSNSKSITAAARQHHLSRQARPGTEEAGENGDETSFDTLAETNEIETAFEESTATTGDPMGFRWESVPVGMASRDPYGDFRSSMEEMVMAHQLWDWSALKELLRCYLRLNEKTTHKIITLAFVDLSMHLASQGMFQKL